MTGSATTTGFMEILVLFFLGSAGAMVSVFHLGHPVKMHTALKNPWRSWLSREGIFLSLFLGTAFLQMIFGASGGHYSLSASLFLTLIGLILLFCQAMVYVVPGYCAMQTGAPVLLFLFSSLTTGVCLSGWFGNEAWQQTGAQIALIIFSTGCLFVLVLPWTWRQNSIVVSDTAKAWYRSPLYYYWVCLGFVLPIMVLIIFNTLPIWLPILVSAAEIMGRILFFTKTGHASSYIGKL